MNLGGSNTGPAYYDNANGYIYLAEGNQVEKIKDNGTDGTSQWSYDASATVSSGPIPFGGRIFFGRNSGRYYALDDVTGLAVGNWPYRSRQVMRQKVPG